MHQSLKALQRAIVMLEEFERVIGNHGIEADIVNFDDRTNVPCVEITHAAYKGKLRLEWGLFWNPNGPDDHEETSVFVSIFTNFEEAEKVCLSPQINLWYYPSGEVWDTNCDDRLPEELTKLFERFRYGDFSDARGIELASCLAGWYARQSR